MFDELSDSMDIVSDLKVAECVLKLKMFLISILLDSVNSLSNVSYSERLLVS